MTRVEAGNLLMVGAGIISALHTGLFAVWVTAVVGCKLDIAHPLACFGIIFITLNIIFWWLSRYKFQKEIIKSGANERLNIWISIGLMSPFILIAVGWMWCLGYPPTMGG